MKKLTKNENISNLNTTLVRDKMIEYQKIYDACWREINLLVDKHLKENNNDK